MISAELISCTRSAVCASRPRVARGPVRGRRRNAKKAANAATPTPPTASGRLANESAATPPITTCPEVRSRITARAAGPTRRPCRHTRETSP